ncbi:hypothetical protein CRM22_001380 [Opisthorchis felineus]|uniref:RING-type E3 ubiquitin transferase n=1 Tax=Opisthorchis felineus TaxID=147828 RepID=A0A4S2MB20_OPIFE|nr:hypothetical protein CRM22_001380 [Opisthorchis felineus]
MTDQVTCVICLGILYRPAVLPCKHVFCQECILSAVEKTAYQCPICRCRISNWLRKLKDRKSLVNEDHENQLREMFPRYYHSKEIGLSPMLSKSEQRCLKDLTNTDQCETSASQGEVFSEYLKEVEKFRKLKVLEDQKNEEASLALAFQLLEEDRLSLSADRPFPDSSHQTLPSSCPSTKIISPSQNRPIVSRPNRTLLDYSIDSHRLSSMCESAGSSFSTQGQIAQDEAFARKLQAKYSLPLRTPPTTRSKHRVLRSRRR